MRKQTLALLVLALALAGSARAQFGRMGTDAFNSNVAKLFGNNTTFSADIEFQMSGNQQGTMPGKIAFDNGKTRFETDFSNAKGNQMSPEMAKHMKDMGMDKTAVISRPDLKTSYIVYPGLSAYAEAPVQDPDAGKTNAAFNPEISELGRETVDGHPCIKNRVVVTDDQGQKHESTTWNATDLKNFPIKIETSEQGRKTTMVFTNVKLSKPDDSAFTPPSDYKKYSSQMELMQAEMMKRMGGMPPGHPAPGQMPPGHP